MEQRRSERSLHVRLAGAPDARDDHTALLQPGNVLDGHALEGRILDDERLSNGNVFGAQAGRGCRARLCRRIHSEEAPQHEHRRDDPENPDGIRDGIAERRKVYGSAGDSRRRDGLLRGAERRRVRRRSREETDGRRGDDSKHRAHRRGHDPARDDDPDGYEVQPKPVAAERREEAGSELEADHEHEEHEPEFPDELDNRMIDLESERGHEDPCKEDARDSDPDPANRDRGEGKPEHGDRRIDEDRRGDGREREREQRLVHKVSKVPRAVLAVTW